MRRRRHPRGVSLIEIIVYIAIVSMLMAAVGVYAVGVHDDSMRRTAELDVRTARDALEMYRGSRGRYPDQAEGFGALIKRACSRPNRKTRGATRWSTGCVTASRWSPASALTVRRAAKT